MKKLIIIIVVLALAGGAAWMIAGRDDSGETDDAANGQSATNQTETTEADPTQTGVDQDVDVVEVDISNFAYSPQDLSISAGTTVVWTNRDDVEHTVTPDEDNDTFEGSELLAKDQTYRVTFDTPGTYPYHCVPHPDMTGIVTVTE